MTKSHLRILLICWLLVSVVGELEAQVPASPPPPTAVAAKLAKQVKALETLTGKSEATIEGVLVGLSLEDRQRVLAKVLELQASGVQQANLLAISINQVEQERLVAVQSAAKQNFIGFDWSLGVGVSFDIEGDDRVESASVVNGILRVEEENSAVPRLVAEVHYFFSDRDRKALWGFGPFVGIQTSDEEVLESFALGAMVGWRRSIDSSSSFNLGIGLVLDTDVQVLGDGLTANEPLPDGEDSVRFKKENRLGALLLASFSF